MAMPGNERVWAYASNALTPQQVRRSVWAAERGVYAKLTFAPRKHLHRVMLDSVSHAHTFQVISLCTITSSAQLYSILCMLCAIPLACDLRSVETLAYLGGLTIWPSVAWNTRDIWWGIFWTQNAPCLNCKSLMKERPHQYIKKAQIFYKVMHRVSLNPSYFLL